MKAALAIIATGLSLAVGQLPAHASSEPDARALFERGQRHYRQGAYHRAAGDFMRAYQLRPSPAILFNAAQAYRLARICDVAAQLYREVLDQAPDHGHRDVIVSHIAAMDACASRQLQSRANELDLTLVLDRPAPPDKSNVAGWVVTGTGAALIATSALLAYDSHRASNKVSDAFAEGQSWSPDHAAAADRGRTSQRLAWLSGGLGVVALAGGTYLLLRDDDERQSPLSSPQLAATDRGFVAGWTWGF